MKALQEIASAVGRRDERPNVELAERVAEAGDAAAVAELLEGLAGRDRNVQSDCIKALYEIAERAPELVAPHCEVFGGLLTARNNRLVWGAVTALDAIALSNPRGVHRLLPEIMVAAECGSVIARDHAVGILAKLGTLKAYAGECVPLLLKQLATCPDNQFPMYCEKAAAVFTRTNAGQFRDVIAARYDALRQEPKRKRVAKVLKRITSGE